MTKNYSENSPHRPELLLPVGNKEMCLAAIHNGADAVYMGVPHFNARGRSQDFALEELRELIELCHLYGVKVHLAFNVLIFENELEQVASLLKELILLGPDAFIVQDIGLISLIRKLSPDVPVHGSTQMTVTNHEAIQLLQDLSIKRFVLGREVSLSEMALIRPQTSTELEVFVHGALCVAYSGQCFTSEGLGGRSANRGQCAQSCRLEYDLLVDGEKKELGEKKHLVSPQDLCGLEEIPQLMELGINSFKVEGRLKSPEYVAQAAQSYSEAISHPLSPLDQQKLKTKMAMTYSRGFFSGWLHGVDHQRLVEGSYSAHRGIKIGSVIKRDKQNGKDKKKIFIKTSFDLKEGQGLLLAWQADGQKKERGGKIASLVTSESHKDKTTKIYQITLWTANKKGEDASAPELPTDLLNDNNNNNENSEIKVYLNSDPQLDKELGQSFHCRESLKRIPLSMKIVGTLGAPLELQISDGLHSLSVKSQDSLTLAEKSPLTAETLREVMGQLGGTCFSLNEKVEKDENGTSSFQVHLEPNLFLHHRDLKELRQKATRELALLRMKPKRYEIYDQVSWKYPSQGGEEKNEAQLHLLLRERAQVEELIELLWKSPELRQNLGDIILDYEFGKDFAPSVEALREHGLTTGIATTRILKPKEYHNFSMIEKAMPDVILVRNLGALQYFSSRYPVRLKGDFSLNTTNHLTLDYLLSKGLSTLCASYDLSASQLKDLVRACPPHRLEVTLHQYMPLFHMEHCVFAAFLSKGSSFRDCGRPCEKHKVELRDSYGHTHFLKADQECRNTMFQGKAQSAAALALDLMNLGVNHFRLELLDEKGEKFEQKVLGYSYLLQKRMSASELLQSLGTMEKYGVNEGTLGMERHYHDRKKS